MNKKHQGRWAVVFTSLVALAAWAGYERFGEHTPAHEVAIESSAQGHRTKLPSPVEPVGLYLADGRLLRLNARGSALHILDPQATDVLQERPLPEVRRHASLTMLPSGRILVWGGLDERGRVRPSGLWYDPVAQSFDAAEIAGLTGRAEHTATVLTDGLLLLAGGRVRGKAVSPQLWDEISGEVVELEMATDADGRQRHRARLQADGSVLLSGGVNARGISHAADTLYDPEHRRFSGTRQQATRDMAAAPVLAGSLPVSGSRRTPLDGRLALRFNLPLKVDELNASSVTLLGPGGNAAIDVVAAENGRLLFVSPRQELFPDSDYSVFVDGVHATTGQPLPQTVLSFHTAMLSEQGEALEAPLQGGEGDMKSGVLRQVTGEGGYACEPGAQGYRHGPCRRKGLLRDGVWTPGQDSTDHRWRVQGASGLIRRYPSEYAGFATRKGFASLTGRILRVDDQPVANVEVGIGDQRTYTDRDGYFLLPNVPAGRQELYVDGASANSPGVEYGEFVYGVSLIRDRLTELDHTMYLPRITERDKIRIPSPTRQETVISHPDIPGFEIRLPKGVVLRDRKGKVVTELAIVPTPVNRAPFPLPQNYPMFFTLHPGGAMVQGLTPEAAKGIRVHYPNYDQYQPGQEARFWIYDIQAGWQVYGKGRVNDAGTHFVPDEGVALHRLVCGMFDLPKYDPASERDKPPCVPCGGGGAGGSGGATAGDPIDLKTGKFVYTETDLAIDDIAPLALMREYRPSDLVNREFGIGTRSGFGYNLYSQAPFDTIELVLPNGSPILFERESGDAAQGVWRASGTMSEFTGAVLKSEFMSVYERAYSITLADGSSMLFDTAYYTGESLLKFTQDSHGNRTEYFYDAGLLSLVASPSGRFISFSYDGENRITAATDNSGRTVSYSYNADGLLDRVTYPDTSFRRYEYLTHHEGGDLAVHRVKAIYDQRGHRLLLNAYSSAGVSGVSHDLARAVGQTYADGSQMSIQYEHMDGGVSGVLVTEPDGGQRRVVFGDDMYPGSDTVGYGTAQAQVHLFERNSDGQIAAHVDPLGRRTELQYDGQGRTTRVTRLAGTVKAVSVQVEYNNRGDVSRLIDPLARVTEFEYDGRCLSRITTPAQEVTRVVCNREGLPVSVTDPLQKSTQLEYSGYDLTAIVDPLGRRIEMRYDDLGRMIARTDPLGNVSRIDYDVMGRIAKVVEPDGATAEMAYDANGNVTDVLLPHGAGITYAYDNLDRLIERRDSLDQAESWSYDTANRFYTYTDRKGQVTRYDYDVLGQVVTTTYADQSTVTASYDSGSRLIGLVDSLSGSMGWDYDDFDRVIEVVTPQGTVGYTYDVLGRRTHMAAANQAQIEYQYDPADRLKRILQGSEVVEFDYDAAGRRTGTTLPNGVKAGYAYDDASRLTGIAYLKADDTVLGELGYAYDVAGRRIAQTGSLATQAMPALNSGANSFDDNNRQTAYNGQALSYDANGNLTGDGVRSYVWNARNQLARIEQGGATIASFTYDATGRRTSRTEGGATVGYLYDGLNAIEEQIGINTNPILVGSSIDERFARNESGGRQYFLTDAQGSTRALTDASGNLVERYDYSPYGVTQATNGGFDNPYRYTGREQDDNGLYYYRARYYHQGMGRFISEDPIGLEAGWNMYAYVLGDPVTFSDPTGNFLFLLPMTVPYAMSGILAGAFVGGLNGAFGAYVNGGDVWAGAGWGALTGGALGFFGAYALTPVSLGLWRVGISAAGNAVGQLSNSRKPCWKFSWSSFGGSALGRYMSHPMSPGVGPWAGAGYTGSMLSQVGQRTAASLPGASVAGTGSIAGSHIGRYREQNRRRLSGGCGC